MQENKGISKVLTLHYGTGNEKGKVLNVTEELIKEAAPDYGGYEPFKLLREEKVRGKTITMNMLEAAMLKPDFANLLRQDLRFIAFNQMAAMPASYTPFTWDQPSSTEQEEYLRDAGMGVIPRAPSGTPAPEVKTDLEGGTIIKNFLYRMIAKVSGDMIRYDQVGKMRQIGQEMGRSAAMTSEAEVYAYLTTTANYGRADTTGDNDIGANQQTLTWNADSLRTALAIISTGKDPKSGAYMGLSANTVVSGPLMEVPILQLLTTTDLSRANSAATEVIGTGDVNVLGDGRIDTVVLSPWFGNSYGWALADRRANGFTKQTVEPFNVYQETQGITSESWLILDVIKYLVRGTFGIGFIDDRAWFYSDSVTDGTVS
jgi:hypothetical protein